MLLKEDGHLDVKKVEMLNEEELEKEMEDWGDDEALEWESRKGALSLDEFFDKYDRIISELWHEDK